QPFTGQQRGTQRRRVALVDGRPGAELHLCGTAVETGDAVCPQPRQQVRVVAVTEERFRVRTHRLRVEIGDDGDLVLATDRRQHCPDFGVRESRVEVVGTFPRVGTHLAGRRILDRYQPGHVCQPARCLFV